MAAPVGYRPVASLDEMERSTFIAKVYQHLFAAVVAFIAFEALLITSASPRRCTTGSPRAAAAPGC